MMMREARGMEARQVRDGSEGLKHREESFKVRNRE